MYQVTLPPKKEIYERLYNLGWEHFLKKSKIHKQLGHKHEYPNEVVQYVKLSILEYNETYACKCKYHSTIFLTQRDQATIITVLFKNHPNIIADLKSDGVLK